MATPHGNANQGTSNRRPHPLLEEVNLHDQSQFDELLRQRKICGWDKTPQDILSWRDQYDKGTQYFFWILSHSSESAEPQNDKPQYAGHIAMSRKENPYHHYTHAPSDPVIPDQVQHIGNLFILPEYRTLGLGRKAMEAIETIARLAPYGGPEIKAMTLSCLHKRYIDDDSSDEWRPFAEKVYGKLGLEVPPRGRGNQDWYERLGYIVLGEEPTIPTGEFRGDGSEIWFICVGMRKDLL